MKYSVEYSNATSPDDDGFWEWWTVSSENRSFKCDSDDDAVWLCELLNKTDSAPDTIRITVTQEHINHGQLPSLVSNPLALALQSISEKYDWANRDNFTLNNVLYIMPEHIVKYAFPKSIKDMKPFSFIIPI